MTVPSPHGLTQLRDALREFAAERDWDQFHSPKNLASALAVEAAELLECFQWLSEAQSRQLSPEQRALLEEFERSTGAENYRADEGFFDKLKSAFR